MYSTQKLKPLVSLIFATVLLTFSCKKKESPAEEQPTPTPTHQGPKPDSIVYTDLIPDMIINSVDTSYYDNLIVPDCDFRIIPQDTGVMRTIDLDRDNIGDIVFVANNAYNYKHSSPHSCPVELHLHSYFVSSTDSFMCIDRYYDAPKKYLKGDTIKTATNFVSRVFFKRTHSNYYPFFLPGQHYVGIKQTINQKTYFGWINVEVSGNEKGANHLIVKEFAINKTPGNSIIVGQTK